jgi:hypothetical protein
MENQQRKLAMPVETHYKVPESVVASEMSFVMEKDQPKSEGESEVFAEPAKEDLDETQNGPKSLSVQENIENDYPKTLKLVTILVAVMLAVFLVALDMVSLICPS